MTADATAPIAKPTRTRSAVTSGRRILDGIDCRTTSGRRFHDLVRAFSSEVGPDPLSESERCFVRQAAVLTLAQEAMSARVVNGEQIEMDFLIRAAGEARRVLLQLRGTAIRKPPAPATMRERMRIGA